MYGTHFRERIACPGCLCGDVSTVVNLPYDADPVLGFLRSYYSRAADLPRWLAGGRYRLDVCRACELVYQRFVGDDALLAELYDRWLSESRSPEREPAFVEALVAPATTRDGHELLAAASYLRRPASALRVLDYGMGWGQWAIVAQRLGAESLGYDLSAARRRFASEHGVVTVNHMDAIEPATLDFINAEQVLEHVDAPLELVRTLRTKLRPGGILKIAVPRSRGIAARVPQLTWREADLGRRINAVHPLEHVNCFSPRSIAAMASQAGLARTGIRAWDYLAFTRQRGATPARARALAKALARPLYHHLSRTNLYVWLRASS